MTRIEELKKLLPPGFSFDTWSPGDGVTRYRFFSVPAGDFFAHNGIYTALGHKEATTFAEGLRAGYFARDPEIEELQADFDAYKEDRC